METLLPFTEEPSNKPLEEDRSEDQSDEDENDQDDGALKHGHNLLMR